MLGTLAPFSKVAISGGALFFAYQLGRRGARAEAAAGRAADLRGQAASAQQQQAAATRAALPPATAPRAVKALMPSFAPPTDAADLVADIAAEAARHASYSASQLNALRSEHLRAHKDVDVTEALAELEHLRDDAVAHADAVRELSVQLSAALAPASPSAPKIASA